MVMARLHIICGNCGCNDEFRWEYSKDYHDCGDGTFESDVVIKCDNCSTIHNLSDNAQAINKG